MSAPRLGIDGPAAPPRRDGELAFSEPWSRPPNTIRAVSDAAVVAVPSLE